MAAFCSMCYGKWSLRAQAKLSTLISNNASLWILRSAEFAGHKVTRPPCWPVTGSIAAGTLLGHDETAGGGEQKNREQALGFETQRGLAHGFHRRASVVHEDDSVRIHLGKKAPNFLLAERRVTVAEKHVDAARDIHFEAGLVARVDPLREAGFGEAFLCGIVDLFIEFAGNHAAGAIFFQALGDAKCAET